MCLFEIGLVSIKFTSRKPEAVLCHKLLLTFAGQLLKLLGELYALQPRVGYYLLYFLNASNRHIQRDWKAKANVYRDLCEQIDSKFSLDICLVNDMRQCQEDDVSLFVHLVPDIYR